MYFLRNGKIDVEVRLINKLETKLDVIGITKNFNRHGIEGEF